MIYISECCDVRAEKQACIRTLEDKKNKEYSKSSLGKWHCTACGKKAKVKAIKE